jgi:hypothetical protein
MNWGSLNRWGNAALDNLGRRCNIAVLNMDNFRWRWNMNREGNRNWYFDNLANLLVRSVDGNLLWHRVHASQPLNGADLLLNGMTTLIAHNGPYVAIDYKRSWSGGHHRAYVTINNRAVLDRAHSGPRRRWVI